MTTIVGTPPACRLRTAPRPMASELSTTAHGLHAARCIRREAVAGVTVRPAARDEPRQCAGRIPGSHDKATERAECVGGRRAQEVEARHRRLEPGVQLGIAVAGAQSLPQPRCQECVPTNVHAITGGEEQVIDEAFGVVTEPEAKLRAGRRRRGNRATRGDAHRSLLWDETATT